METVSRPEIAESDIVACLQMVYDPEISVNIYDLGLIYRITVFQKVSAVHILMTLTSPACPVAGEIPEWVKSAALMAHGVEKVEVELTFDPPWNQDMMTDEAKLELHMYGVF